MTYLSSEVLNEKLIQLMLHFIFGIENILEILEYLVVLSI
jgi:hypothetical protein